jgi:hypothetical protein
MNDQEKQTKFDKLRKEFEKIMYLKEKRVKDVMGNLSVIF